MDTDKAMDAVTEGAKAVTKFQEILQKMFNPHWTRKQDKADAEADERKIQMIRNNPDMEIVFVNGEMSARQRTPDELAQRAEQRLLAEAVRQENNLENVIDVASADLLLENDIVDEPVDEDWIARLFNIAKDVSNTEMQYVWGKILAGEVKRPGSFSFRTLETIRNLSQYEATVFQKIMPIITRIGPEYFITSKNDILQKYGINFGDILLLDECGLINSDSTVSMNLRVSKSSKVFLCNEAMVAVIAGYDDSPTDFSFGIYDLTRVGKELYQILVKTPNPDIVADLAEDIFNKNNKTIKISIHKVNELTKNNINYSTNSMKTFDKDEYAEATT